MHFLTSAIPNSFQNSDAVRATTCSSLASKAFVSPFLLNPVLLASGRPSAMSKWHSLTCSVGFLIALCQASPATLLLDPFLAVHSAPVPLKDSRSVSGPCTTPVAPPGIIVPSCRMHPLDQARSCNSKDLWFVGVEPKNPVAFGFLLSGIQGSQHLSMSVYTRSDR